MHKLYLLLLFSLLLGTAACSKKEDGPAAPTGVPGTASYKLNGQLITCTPTVELDNSGLDDILTIRLLTTPKPASGDEYLSIRFVKAPGQPNSAYKLFEQRFFTDKTSALGTSLISSGSSVLLKETSTGGFSGTFAGEANSSAFSYRITEGVFIDLHL